MPGVIQPTTPQIILPATVVTATGNSPVFNLKEAECYALYLVATAVTGTTPTLNAILQSSVDNGTTWVNLPIVFSTLSAVGYAGPLIFKPTMGIGAAGVAPVIAAGTAQAVNTPFNQNQMRLAFTATGTTPSFTVALYSFTAPKGYSTV